MPPRICSGYLSEVNARKVEQDPYYKSGDVIGVGGLESYYEKEMRGRRGVSYVLVDVHNNQKGSFKDGHYDTLAVEGKDLFTGIDLDMQRLGEQLMVNKKGSIVALDPRTGEVLCLVSSPTLRSGIARWSCAEYELRRAAARPDQATLRSCVASAVSTRVPSSRSCNR